MSDPKCYHFGKRGEVCDECAKPTPDAGTLVDRAKVLEILRRAMWGKGFEDFPSMEAREDSLADEFVALLGGTVEAALTAMSLAHIREADALALIQSQQEEIERLKGLRSWWEVEAKTAKAQLQKAISLIEEVSLAPYEDSDPESLLETLRQRALTYLAK